MRARERTVLETVLFRAALDQIESEFGVPDLDCVAGFTSSQ